MNELGSNKVYLQGCDAQGRTVFIVLAKQQEKGRPEETKRFICYTLDNAIAAGDPVRNELGQFLCLFDLSGMQHIYILSFWLQPPPLLVYNASTFISASLHTPSCLCLLLLFPA